jgi:uncharacterized iron-regulated membrane protein
VASQAGQAAFVWTHRWSALVLSLGLLVVTTSGVPLLYEQEITRAIHSSAYEEADGAPRLSFADARAAVREHDPEFAPASIYTVQGVYVAEDFETGRRVTVDPGTGAILGDFTLTEDEGFVPLLLAITGLSTWFYKRGLRKRRAKRLAAA